MDLNIDERKGDTSEALAQVLQEKVLDIFLSPVVVQSGNLYALYSQPWILLQVAALLLLSQQEERHLLERNVNAALQKKIEELQRNLLQVTFLTSDRCLFYYLLSIAHKWMIILP